MIFCPKCGSILLPQKGKDNMLVKCKCGYKSEMENIVITEKIDEAKKIDVVDVEGRDLHRGRVREAAAGMPA